MKSVNLSQWAVAHAALVAFFMILVTVAGGYAYFHLGRDEDPQFTVKTMVVRAYLPGATIAETTLQLTDRIEKKLQETPFLDYLKSYTLAGETTIFVHLLSSTDKKDVPDIWYQVRKKVGDIRAELPSSTIGPFFNDEFGDTFGIIYAFTSDGFTHRELKDYVETVRDELLQVPDVAKVAKIGFQDEKVYIEFSSHQLANLGIERGSIIAALQAQNILTPTGIVDTEKEQVMVEATGKFDSEEDLKNVTVYAGSKKIRLVDIATITRATSDPPQPRFRANGRDAIALAIHMRKGGDVLALEKNVAAQMAALRAEMPIGIEAHLVANQPQVVHKAVNEFMKALIEAVAIVLGISFISLGLRAGAVVAFAIPLVLACVFLGMQLGGIDLQRISLGALIIALGLLVDDAMITVEVMVSKLEQGWRKVKAATFAYTSIAFPMLTGTLVTIFGFVPIGFAQSDAGEYTYSLFAVVAMALLISWFVAVIFTPLIGVKLLREKPEHHEPRKSKAVSLFHDLLLFTMHRPKATAVTTVAVFATALAAWPLVPSQFFPASERPELLVNLTLHQSASIDATSAVVKRVEEVLKNDTDIDHWSTYVGRGAIRFYLPLDEQLENDFFAQAVVVTKSAQARERVRARLQKALDHQFPELVAGLFSLELGPPVGWPVQYRVSGKDPDKVRHVAQKVAAIMATAPGLQNIHFNWGDAARKLKIDILQEEARRLGLSSAAIAQAIYTTVSGVTATQIRDSIYLIDVVLRAQKNERVSIEDLRTLSLPLPNGKSVPLSAVATLSYVQDYPLIWRRDRLPTLTVQGNVKGEVLPATIVAQLKGKIDELNGSLPNGYKIAVGGTVEESAKSEASVMAVMPVVLLLFTAALMIQLENFKHLVLVLSVAPLGLIGVVFALLATGKPLGFVALLGIVALIGMIVRNSVILVHQIEVERQRGHSDWQAVVNAATVRFRPIMLTAFAASFGMIPIAPTVFWGPMAYAIIGGLAGATVLTLIFLPSLYVLWFGVEETRPAASAVVASEA
jgi:multidrug efflux pump subunit AcrB